MQKALTQLFQHALPCSPSQVHNYGGVLVEEDFSNYSVIVEDPVHTVYRGKCCCLTHCHTTAVKSLLHLAGGDSVCNSICRKALLGDSFCCLLSLVHQRRFRRFLELSNGPVFFLGSDPLCFDRILLCKDAISRRSWITHYCLHLKMTPKVDLQRRKACFMQKKKFIKYHILIEIPVFTLLTAVTLQTHFISIQPYWSPETTQPTNKNWISDVKKHPSLDFLYAS